MKKGNRKKGTGWGILFVTVGGLCLAVGIGLLIKHAVDTKHTREQMEVLKNQLELDEARRRQDEGSKIVTGEPISPATDQTAQAEPSKDPASEETAPAGTVSSETEKEPSQSTSADESTSHASDPTPAGQTEGKNPYASYFKQNSDMAAWLKIDGTVIDYPVMQTMADENYYLKRGFDKKENSNGCLILDTDSCITGEVSTNLIIHGHNMKSGAMFGTLTKYEKEDYCKEHSKITLYTKECRRDYEVIAVFRSQVFRKTDDVFKYYKFFQADTQEEFDDWYDNIKAMSEFDTGVTAQFGDRFITLSTCVYHVENGRLVVVAKETGQGEIYQ